MAEPDVVPRDEFKVAGLGHRGPAGEEFDDIWAEFNERADDLASTTTGGESYGVAYEYDEGGDDSTYVTGVPVEDADDLAPELTVVAVPAGPYAVFETSATDVTELLSRLDGDWSLDGDDERVMGPMFERYDSGYDSVSRDGTVELYVPVDDA